MMLLNFLTQRLIMFNFISGIVIGIIVATAGFSGIAKMLDNGVDKIKNTVQEQTQETK